MPCTLYLQGRNQQEKELTIEEGMWMVPPCRRRTTSRRREEQKMILSWKVRMHSG